MGNRESENPPIYEIVITTHSQFVANHNPSTLYISHIYTYIYIYNIVVQKLQHCAATAATLFLTLFLKYIGSYLNQVNIFDFFKSELEFEIVFKVNVMFYKITRN